MKRSIYAIILFLSIFLLFLSTTFTQGKSYIEDKNSSSINQEEDNFVKITGETIDRLKKKIWFELDDKALKSLKAEMDDDKLEVLKPLKNLKFSKEDLLEALTNINLTEEDITIIEKYTENKISSDRLTLLKELINIQYKEQEVRNKLEETGFTKSEIDVILGYAEVYSSQKETGERLYKWLNYTVKDGLIYNGVMTFEFDPQGYAWIGTGNDADPKFGGVSVLNPRGDFMSYTIKDGLADNRINDILFLPLKDEDLINPSKGGIWFATGYGLTKLDRKGKKKTYDKANSDLPDNRVSSLLLDDEGNLWVSTFGGGVAVIDQEGKWVIYNRSNGLAGNKVVPSFKDKDGNLWFGIWDGGLSCLEPGLFINEEILENLKKNIDKKKLENLKTLQNKNYSTAELIRNLKELKFEEKEIEIIVKQAKYSGKKWTNYSMGNSGLLSNSVTSIAQNPVDGKMWFATSEGLSTFDGKEWINYQAEKTPFVISNFITSLAFEKDGDLWIGYWGAGVTCLSKDETFRNFKAENSELISNYVGTVAIDRDNNKWFGTYSGFSVLHTEERDELTGDPVFKEFYSRIPFNGPFNLIGKPLWSDFYSFNGRKGIYKVLPENFNTSAYHWQIAGSEKEQRVSLRFALPIDHYGNVTWSYGAFWGEGVNLRQGGDMSYSITEDMMGNIWAEFSGIIRGADFLSYGYVTEFTKPIIDKNKDYPFPQKIPAEVEKYLLPGRYIPSDNPDIYKKAKSLVKESSSKDMYLTMKDILYSDLFRDMPYDYSINIS
ncbi:MAG TPA: two-component regulator propeller domain-containing protein, partial [Candidatus Eremiobacteraeota bacterium]|nr:two-component regulator propeller domain-containing protein [Candidatus Eremiobacteraeota bacterium]